MAFPFLRAFVALLSVYPLGEAMAPLSPLTPQQLLSLLPPRRELDLLLVIPADSAPGKPEANQSRCLGNHSHARGMWRGIGGDDSLDSGEPTLRDSFGDY